MLSLGQNMDVGYHVFHKESKWSEHIVAFSGMLLWQFVLGQVGRSCCETIIEKCLVCIQARHPVEAADKISELLAGQCKAYCGGSVELLGNDCEEFIAEPSQVAGGGVFRVHGTCLVRDLLALLGFVRGKEELRSTDADGEEVESLPALKAFGYFK